MELKCSKLTVNQFDFLLHSIQSHIGNKTLKKCLLNENDDECQILYTKCTAKILDEKIYSKYQNSNPFLNLFNTIVQKFHETHKCSCKTLVCLTILLWKRLNVHINEDINSLVKHLKTLLGKSIEHLKTDTTILNRIQVAKPVQKVTKSRHFNNNALKNFKFDVVANEAYFKKLLRGLCRSQDFYSDIIYGLLEYHQNEDLKFDCSKISILNTLNLIDVNARASLRIDAQFGQGLNYEIVTGVLFEIDASVRDLYLKNGQKSDYNTLLFDSSIDYNFIHVGFNFRLKHETFSKIDNKSGSYDDWLNSIKAILIQNKIKLLLLTGGIDENLYEFCRCNSIMILKNINLSKLKQISTKFLVYFNDFSGGFILRLKLVLCDEKYLRILVEDPSCVSVLIKVSVLYKSQLELIEDELKHCLKRIGNVLDSGLYINGCVEQYVANYLRDFDGFDGLCDNDMIDFYLAKELLMNTFEDYCSILKANEVEKDDYELFYDDFKSKLEAFNECLDLIELFASIDFSIHD